jgi:dipeptidyl aminopeptidase/acylaminoacyl peptidase
VVPFDLDALEVTGTPVPVLDDVSVGNVYAFYSVSDDGSMVYLRGISASDGDDELVLMDLETGNTETYPLSPRAVGDLRLAPDGRRVLFGVTENDSFDQANAWLYDLELRTSPRQLTFDGRVAAGAWSPSGDRIALSRDLETGAELLLEDPDDDSAPTRVDLPEGSELYVEDWYAPDSLLMNGRVGPGGTVDLWIAPVQGGEPRLYLSSEGLLFGGDVAPSGDHASYLLSDDEGRELMVRSFPDPGQPIRIARRSSADGSLDDPDWSLTEPIIYYQVRHPDADTLYAAHWSVEPSFGLDSTTVVWVQASRIGVTDPFPDGSRMLAARPVADDDEDQDEDARERRAILVLNWFEELRERLEGG